MVPKKNWNPGNVVEIKLEDDSFAYGVVITASLMAFSNKNYSTKQIISNHLFNIDLFKIWVMKYAIGKNGWPVVGQIELTNELLVKPKFYKQDSISGKFYHYVDCVNDIQVKIEDCINLECAAVWDPAHVESRLFDAKKGVKNKWVESLKAKNKV